MKRSIIISLTTAALLSSAAFAETTLPTVISGGVGEEEEAYMQSVQHNYNTKLVFTGERGMYLADVAVSIRDKNGKEVVNGVSDGPMLLVELVPGRYTVQAETEGFTKTRNIQVGANTKTYTIQFPVTDDQKSQKMSSLEDRGYKVTMYFPG